MVGDTWDAGMLPLYAARIEDLGVGDFVKADCAACPCRAADAGDPAKRRTEPRREGARYQGRLRCRGCGRKGRAVVAGAGHGAEAISTPLFCRSVAHFTGHCRRCAYLSLRSESLEGSRKCLIRKDGSMRSSTFLDYRATRHIEITLGS